MSFSRSRLAGPLASGALHVGLLGVLVGVGAGTVPPVPHPISVELVRPDALTRVPEAGGAREALSPAAAPSLPSDNPPHETTPPAGAAAMSVDPVPAVEKPAAPAARPALASHIGVDSPRPRPRGTITATRTMEPATPSVPATQPPAAARSVEPAPRDPGGTVAALGATGLAAPTPVALAGNPAPVYPGLARQRGIQGRVMLRVLVTGDGRPSAIEIVRSSGSDMLDDSAREAVSRWSFLPARVAGVAVATSVDVPITFDLAAPTPQ